MTHNTTNLPPLLCAPQYFERIWGGRNLERLLDRELPGDEQTLIGESWEISDVPGSPSPIENSDNAPLSDLLANHGTAILGADAKNAQRFPLLVKYLDANDLLSVQVHPDDEYAARYENGASGKSEMWLVLHAEPNAELIAGVIPDVDRDEFACAVEENRVSEVLARRVVRTGDVVLMPAGRLHALGTGLIVLEIQQTSDVTYRLYDWDRVDANGKSRDLHIDRGLDVIRFDDRDDPVLTPFLRETQWGTRSLLAVTQHFMTERWEMNESAAFSTSAYSPDLIMAVTTSVAIRPESGPEVIVPKGRSAVIPAALGNYRIDPHEHGMVVRSRVPVTDDLTEWKPRTTAERGLLRGLCDSSARTSLLQNIIV